MVTVEVALVLPILVAVAVGCVWFVDVARSQALAQDAARVVVREMVRATPSSQARQEGLRILPGSSILIGLTAESVSVQVRYRRSWLAPIGTGWTHLVSARSFGRLESDLPHHAY